MQNLKSILIRRLIAFVIDWNLIFLIGFGLFISGPEFKIEYLLRPSIRMFSAYGVLLSVLSFALLPLIKDCVFKGSSLGKLICGIRVYDNNSKDIAKTSSLILRNLTFYIPFVELIVALCNNGRTLGDMLSSSYVDLRKRAGDKQFEN